MSSKNLTITLTKDEHVKLDELVIFFNKKSISNVTKSDIVKFLINKAHSLSNSPQTEEILEFYKHLGVTITIDSTEEFLNELKEQV